jgi:hypothetical protein
MQTRLSLDQLYLDHMTATFPMTPLSPTYWNNTSAVGHGLLQTEQVESPARDLRKAPAHGQDAPTR